MYLSKIRVANYKSFVNSGDLTLGPGFNVICGQNNSGKTALLESLDPNTTPNPHRSVTTVPTVGSSPEPYSSTEVSFSVTRAELLEILRERGPQFYHLPLPADMPPDPVRIPSFVKKFFERDDFEFRLRRTYGYNQDAWTAANFPSFDSYRPRPDNQCARFKYNLDGSQTEFGFLSQSNFDIGPEIYQSLLARIFRFNAERMNLGSWQFGTGTRLLPNATNLAQVLSNLQANTAKFAYLNALVHEILPQIYQVSITATDKPQNNVEIRVWTTDPSAQRLDLAMPLSECGTGIGQVLAMLYVAVFSTSPQILIVDEPQSFLHPGAIRKLTQVLNTCSEHQYIIATHSPTVISAADPNTITICRIKEGVTSLQRIDPNEAKDLQSYLAEVGARLSDIFGADNILWVEGRTEEICFPKIVERVCNRRLRGTALLAVSSTGELKRRDAERIFNLYNRLSQRNSLLPPAVGFIFDSECLTHEEKAELVQRSHNLLKFLPRRMYENYLLNPRAIAAVANDIQGFRQERISDEEIAALISQMKDDNRFRCPGDPDAGSRPWQETTDGAKVLSELFNKLSETCVAFDKVKHCPMLTDWLIANAPADLREVADLIASALPRQD
jgi:hypothetical protein